LKFRFATDIGLVREENQDTVRCEYFGHNVLAVICDGMGGERAGKDASNLAIDEVFHRFSEGYSESLDDDGITKLLESSISAANTVINTKARLDIKNFGMGTTCVAVYVNESTVFVANVGDSRAYFITDDGLFQLTTDHNVAEYLYRQGKITAEEMRVHPQRHMLMRAVGVEKTVIVDTCLVDYNNKVSLLLCSDGLSGYCSDDEIYEVVRSADEDDVATELINLALEKGGRDNVTVAVISG